MPRTLILLRHAKSSWSHPGLADRDRPLNRRGERDAPRMGEHLRESGVAPDRIVSSSARRAQETVEVVARALGHDPSAVVRDERIYDASVADLLDVIHGLDAADETVLLVGHNPGFTDLANDLAGCEIDNVPTCGVVEIAFEAVSWGDVRPGTGKLVRFDYPKGL